MKEIWYIAIALVIWNLIVFVVYALDKRKAKRGDWRISEKALLLMAAFMGGAGALFGMRIFRHKTKHLKFKIGVPLLLVLNIAVIALFIIFNPTFPLDAWASNNQMHGVSIWL